MNVFLDENDGDGGDLGGADPTPATPVVTADPAAAPATPAAVEGDWPSDWRSKLSPDGKHTKTLDRLASPNALMDSYVALRQKVDSGELKSAAPFPDKGTPEEQAAWRKGHDIPEDAKGYSLDFDNGLVIGDTDKPAIDEFVKAMHGSNATGAQVQQAIKWYYEQQDKTLVAREEKDTEFLKASEDNLRAEWGSEYRTNINMIQGLVDTMPESIREIFANARLGDGNALINHPDMARWLVHTARTVNPVATVVPGAGANVATAIEDEIASIEKVLRTDRSAYNADNKMQSRYRELLGARERAAR